MFKNLMEKLAGKPINQDNTPAQNQSAKPPINQATNQPGTCPVCGNLVSMTAEDGSPLSSEVGNVVICNFCAAELEIVAKEPLKFELLEEAK